MCYCTKRSLNRLFTLDEPRPEPCVHATWTRDGPVVSSQLSLVTFVARLLLCMCLYFVRQLPQQYEVRLDSDVFLSVFSTEVNSRREVVLPWALAPGWRSVHIDAEGDGDAAMSTTDQHTLRQSALDQWNRYSAKYSAHIPFCVGDADRVSADVNGVICGNVDACGDHPEQGQGGEVPPAPLSLTDNVPGRYAYSSSLILSLIIMFKPRETRKLPNEENATTRLIMMTPTTLVSVSPNAFLYWLTVDVP